MPAIGVSNLPSPRPVKLLIGLVMAVVLSSGGCQPEPESVPRARREAAILHDPAWFGEPARLSPHPSADFAWALPGLDLQGQPVELMAWEVPALPSQGGEATDAWKAKRDRVTQMLQALVVEGLALTQQVKPPPGKAHGYRLQGRILAFSRQARVGAKAGQVLGNIALVPINLALIFLSNGHMNQLLLIDGVSGYQTEVLFQVKVVDQQTQGTVLALQSWMDFKSLEAPTQLRSAFWALGGGEKTEATWWPIRELHQEAGDLVWFKPGLDLRHTAIQCLTWMPGGTLEAKVREKDLDLGLQATRMPRVLAGTSDGKDGPLLLSETAGSLYLQGECPGSPRPATLGCRVKLWDPATGEVVGLIQVNRGFWRTNTEQDWARRIRRHLLARQGTSQIPAASVPPG